MQVIVPPELPEFPPSVVAVGSFDGIHLGHAHLIRRAVERARAEGLTAVVLTFTPHPQALLRGAPLPMLLPKAEREAKLAALGVNFLVYWPFTTSLMEMAPEEFVREVLVAHLRPRAVYVGFNFTFGYRAQGTPALLEELGRRYGFEAVVEPPVTVNGMVVSSTAIRAALIRGDIPEARKLLGYWPYVRGPVVVGDRRGRLLGFPTANVVPPEGVLLPANGVYASYACLEEKRWQAVLNIGRKPTFGEELPETLEVHLLDYDGKELYGREMRVEFRQRLREEKRFASPEELAAQIERDVEEAKRIFSAAPGATTRTSGPAQT